MVVSSVQETQIATEPWWNKYRGTASSRYLGFVEMESAASVIKYFEHSIVPGIFQHPEYIDVTVAEIAARKRAALKDAQMLRDLRLERQDRIFAADCATQVEGIITMSAIRGNAFPRDVMLKQISHLTDLAMIPRITIQLIAADSTAIIFTARTAFVVTEIEGHAPTAYLEGHGAPFDHLVMNTEKSTWFADAFGELQRHALSPDDSLAFLKKEALKLQ